MSLITLLSHLFNFWVGGGGGGGGECKKPEPTKQTKQTI